MNKISFWEFYPRQKLYSKGNFTLFLIYILKFKILRFDLSLKLEEKLKEITKAKFCIALNTERVGLYLLVKNFLKLNPERNEVIMSPYTIWDMVNMVICAGGKPVFADINKNDLSLSEQVIKDNFTDKTCCVLLTHYQKISQEVYAIRQFCKNNSVYFIEDCAINFGSDYVEQAELSENEFRLFSFGIAKFVGSFSGGAIAMESNNINTLVLDDVKNFSNPSIVWLSKFFLKNLKLYLVSSLFFYRFLIFWIIKYGSRFFNEKISKILDNDPKPILKNFIPNNYLSKISNFQIESILNQTNNSVKKNYLERSVRAEIYYENLKNIKELQFITSKNNYGDSNINFPIFLKNRDKLYYYLIQKNFDVSTYFYKNCNNLEIFKTYKKNLPNLEFIENNILVLPTYPQLPKKNILNICDAIEEYFKNINH
jgi:dTDP-4-amino-4,6-dideoxygalactose transaminase